jgi:toxin ParE1/3/4
MRIVWSPRAVDRVVEIARWISRSRPMAAARLVDELFAAVRRLSRFPQSGRQVPETGRPELREILHRGYRIIYRLEQDQLEVLTVRHSRQRFDEEEVGTAA